MPRGPARPGPSPAPVDQTPAALSLNRPVPAGLRSATGATGATGAVATPHLLALQRMVGNRATARLLTTLRRPGPASVPGASGPRLPVQRGAVPPVVVQRAGVVVQRAGARAQDVTRAIGDLRDAYPNVREGLHAGVTSGQADEFWQAHLAGKDLAALVDAMLRDFLGAEEKAGKEITISVMYASGQLGLRVDIEGDEEGARTTSVNQWFSVDDDGELRVELRSVYAQGRGRAFMGKGLLPFFDALGVTRIWLDASGIGGSNDGVFAWARYGFVPFPQYWATMQDYGNKLLRGEYRDVAWRGRAAEVLASGDPKALRHLVELSWTTGDAAAKKFLNRVLQADLTWEGELDLADADSRRWIERYAAGAGADRFSELLVDLPQPRQLPVKAGCCTLF